MLQPISAPVSPSLSGRLADSTGLQRWGQLVLTGLLGLLVGLVLSGGLRYAWVQGESMAPTLHSGQVLLVERLSYWIGAPQRGEVVVLHVTAADWIMADVAGNRFLKRIVGLPGETVELRGGHVYVNGERLAEPSLGQRQTPDTKPVVVPAGAYYLLGDNSAASDDSRLWGPLPASRIQGRAWLTLWPLHRLGHG